MTTPVVIEITRNGNPVGKRDTGGPCASPTTPVRRPLRTPLTAPSPHARVDSERKDGW